MNKKLVFSVVLFLIVALGVGYFLKNSSKEPAPVVMRSEAIGQSLQSSSSLGYKTQSSTGKNTPQESVESFALNLAKNYFDANPQFDSEGLSVQRVLDVRSGEICGDYQIVIFEKNGIYGGSASVKLSSSGKYEYLSVGPGNYSDREHTANSREEKPYLTLEEATEKVLALNPHLVFDGYSNPCIILPNGEGRMVMMHMHPFFRFLNEQGESYLFAIDGVLSKLIDEKTLIERHIQAAHEIEDPNWNKVHYTPEQVTKFYHSQIPEERIKATYGYDHEKTYQLIFDQDASVQRAALQSIEEQKTPSGKYYIEEYYRNILASEDLSFDAFSAFTEMDFEKFSYLTREEFWQEATQSPAFQKLSQEDKDFILFAKTEYKH